MNQAFDKDKPVFCGLDLSQQQQQQQNRNGNVLLKVTEVRSKH